MKKFLIIFFIFLFFSASASAEGKLFCYNTHEQLFNGNTEVFILPTDLERCLIQFPKNLSCLLLGTVGQKMKNGEIVGWGTVANHRFFWLNPEYPFDQSLLDKQRINWAVLAVFDPAKSYRLTLEKGADLFEAVLKEIKKLNLNLAAFEVQGVLNKTRYSLIYNLPAGGVNPEKISDALYFFNYPEPAYWHLLGFYAANEKTQKAIASDSSLIMSGIVAKNIPAARKNFPSGGRISQATIGDAEIIIYPLTSEKIFLTDLKLNQAEYSDGKLIFKITNASPLWAEHILVDGLAGFQEKFAFRLSTMAPFSSQKVEVPLSFKPESESLLIRVNAKKNIYEENFSNNQLSLGERAPDTKNYLVFNRGDAIWQMDSAGANARIVEGLKPASSQIFRNPVWSHDRTQIAYYAFDKWPEAAVDLVSAPMPTIFIFNTLSKKNFPVFRPVNTNEVVDDLSFSGGDEFLYFTLSQARQGESIVRLDLNNFQPRTLVEGAFQADLSPDGQKMVYVSFAGGYKNIVLSNPAGENKKIILSFGRFFDFAWPKFSPDSTKIILSASSAKPPAVAWSLWLYDLKSENLGRVLEKEAGGPFCVSWSATGDKIIFSNAVQLFSFDFKNKEPKPIAAGELPSWY